MGEMVVIGREREDRKEYLDALKLEMGFLGTFLRYAAPRCIQYHQDLEHLLIRAQDLEFKASMRLEELVPLRRSSPSERLIAWNNAAAHKLGEVKLVNSEIRPLYRMLSRQLHHPMSNDQLLMNFINSLLLNIKDLLSVSRKVDIVGTFKTQLEALEGSLRFLTTFLMFVRGRCSEQEKLTRLFNHAKLVADNAAYLCHSCLVVVVNKMDEDMPPDSLAFDLSELVRKIDPAVSPQARQVYIPVLHASSELPSQDLNSSMRDTVAVDFVESLMKKLMELLSAGLTVLMRDQIQILVVELAFLRSFLMDPRPTRLPHPHLPETVSSLVLQSKIISARAGSVVYTLFDTEMNEETAKEVHSSLINLLEELKLIKAEITEAIYDKLRKPPYLKFPSTDELGSLDRFLRNLSDLLNNKASSITWLDLLIVPLMEELQFLRSFLSKIAEQHIEQKKLKDLWTRIMKVACKAEYIIDSILVGNGPIWGLKLWLSEVIMEIEFLKAEVNKIGDSKIDDGEVHHGEQISKAPLQTSFPELNEVVVGFEDVEESILEDLARGPTKLQVVALVGMPGQGKTELAKRIYNNPTVKYFFDVCAWCYVSQVYNRKSLLAHILIQVQEHTKRTFETVGEEELAESLYKSLKGNRYFIIMDDLWDVDAWDALRRSFPDDKNGSRIMFTSRLHNLDLKVSRIKIHPLRPFSDDESWQLLQGKVFRSENCPSKLLEVGKLIAKDCNGLPLAVVVVAGVLAKIDKNRHEWSKIANSLSSYIVGEPEKKCIKVIEFSYKHLPDYLKPCFLYIGALVKNKHIRVQKLIYLWIAEGFVHHKVERKSLEDTAEEYLIDLIKRSLIMVVERRSTGGIKKCHIHDLVRDFCLVKAEENNFSSLAESTDIIYKQRRIGCNQPDCILLSKAGYQPVRSLMLFHPIYFCSSSKISSMCHRFKLLSVLNLECIWVSGITFPEGINSLTHLRYLAIGGGFVSVPASISNLWNLETLIVTRCPRDFQLPHTIWKMIKLRHLEFRLSASLNVPRHGVSRLDNLRTISTLRLSNNDNTVVLMKGLASVKHLKCFLNISPDYSGNRDWLQGLATLSQLQSLNLWLSEGWRLVSFPWLDSYDLSLPSNLKKLTMNGGFSMPWNKISIIGELPNLEVLKLLDGAFEGEEWDMTDDGQFPRLKFLKLKGLNIRRWSVSGDYFPPLEQLVLQACQDLEEIPCSLEDIPSLKVIQVIHCDPRLEKVVKQIQQEQLDMGNQDLNVILKHRTRR